MKRSDGHTELPLFYAQRVTSIDASIVCPDVRGRLVAFAIFTVTFIAG
jgi:hypothetical protein